MIVVVDENNDWEGNTNDDDDMHSTVNREWFHRYPRDHWDRISFSALLRKL